MVADKTHIRSTRIAPAYRPSRARLAAEGAKEMPIAYVIG
jgi:hypothetical protein